MKIYFDVGTLNPSRITGVGVYLSQLYQHLQKNPLNDVQTVIKASRWKKRPMIDAYLSSHSQLIVPPPLARLLPGLDRSSAGIYHGPDFRLNWPKSKRVKRVVTIHDCIVFYEEFSAPQFSRQGQIEMSLLLQQGDFDAVIVNSHFTASEVLKFFPVWKNRIFVTPLGCDRDLRSRQAEPVQDLDLPSRYVLFLGVLEKRKNVDGLIKAFEILHQQGFSQHLLLVGPWGFGKEQIQAQLQSSPARSKIICRPFVENSHLKQIYSQAELFAFPSHYEGFGIPVLEAMSQGVPVVTSQAPVLKEISGEAAEFSDSRDPESVAAAMAKVLSSPDRQKQLRQLGTEQAKKFTWSRCAELTEQAYVQIWSRT